MTRPAVTDVLLYDAILLDGGFRETTDGYLVAKARVARTGVQLYRGHEIGRPDLDVVRVFRPEEEVFSKDAMASFAWRPVTNDHPPVDVVADNWKKYAVGQMGGSVARDGDAIEVPLVVMDAAAISDVKGGKRQLSMGYRAVIKWGDGLSPAGEPYDAVQTTIRGNHLAIVATARGGPLLAIGDHQQEHDMTQAVQGALLSTGPALRSFVVDGIQVEMTDTAMQIVDRAIRTLTDRVTKAERDLKTEFDNFEEFKKTKKEIEEEAVKKTEAKDGEIAGLKKQLGDAVMSPEKIDALVRDRASVITTAKKVLGDKLVTDSKSDADIRRQVVVAKLGDAAVKDRSDDYMQAAFDTITAGAITAGGGQRDQLADALSHVQPAQNSQDAREAAHVAYVKNIGDAWKGEPAKAA